MKEIWIETGNKAYRGDTIIKVSNMGRIWRKNGNVDESTLRQQIKINGKMTLIYRFIAEHFIPQTNEDIELGRNHIDHITHNPIGMNVNNILNLRWCTHKENGNFLEARNNMSKAHINNSNHKSEFGIKYYNHYGYSRYENINQYSREQMYYRRHNNRCRWE